MSKVAYSVLLSNMRGKVENAVFSKGRSGPTLRPRVKPHNPRSTAQTGVRANLSAAAKAFQGLAPAQAAAWTAYGQTITKKNPVSGTSYSPAAIDAFTALATKFLQVNPGGTIPLSPPAGSFAGDSLSVTAVGAAGQINWTASAANGANVKTELLVQRLKGANRTPAAKGYRSKGFVAFTAGTLTSSTLLPAGPYAVAYRFVDTQTGQQTSPVTLGIVTVS